MATLVASFVREANDPGCKVLSYILSTFFFFFLLSIMNQRDILPTWSSR